MASDTGIGRAEALGFDPDGGHFIHRGADGQMRMEGCSECQAEIGGTR